MQVTEGVVVHGSRYAAQLRQGFPWLRFAPDLEKEFRKDFAGQHLTRMRIGFLVAIGLYLVFQLLSITGEAGAMAMWGFVLRGAVITAMFLCWVVSFTPMQKRLPVFILFSYACFGAGITGIEVLSNYYGVARHYEGLMLATFHCYVFSGLLLRQALVGGTIIFLSYLVGGLLGGLSGKAWMYQLVFIALTNLIGGVALLTAEHIERDNYLRKRLLHEMAGRDGLTGLYNRTAFLEHIDRAVKQASRERHELGLLMLDLDYFKPYNDRYGHLEGDAALRAVAQAIRNEFRRPLDMIARYGGEEFVGLWYDIDPERLESMAQDVRDAVWRLAMPHTDSPYERVSVSIGVVGFTPRGDESVLSLIRRADEALYAAKNRGRNLAVVDTLVRPQTPAERARLQLSA
ncbi:MAG TPA: GGDEF domain-containing protein [Candidatus Binatia bacterium]|nr:GGDEF domain-containing protein [Candidatus Binatia bacterium]